MNRLKFVEVDDPQRVTLAVVDEGTDEEIGRVSVASRTLDDIDGSRYPEISILVTRDDEARTGSVVLEVV